jgi:hypothetical protein
MTTIQLKTEIHKILDEVPEDTLPDVLDFLKELQQHPVENIRLVSHFKQILAEDKELLEKLAQ